MTTEITHYLMKEDIIQIASSNHTIINKLLLLFHSNITANIWLVCALKEA